jgi:heme-degrading monooxygenase HmoA
MSAVITIHFPVDDVPEAIAALQRNAGLVEEISESTKSRGIRSHRFFAGDGELLVVDEWETAEQFQEFFDGNAQVAQAVESLGVTGPPVVSIFRPIDAPGTI